MSEKRGFIKLVPFAALLSFLSACTTPSGKDTFYRTLSPIFLDLYPRLRDVTGVVYIRFMIFIAVFAVMYYGLNKVFEGKKNTNIAIGLVLSILATIAIPAAILINIVETYSLVVGILLAIMPVALGLWFAHKTFGDNTSLHHIMRMIIYFLLAYIMLTFVIALDKSPPEYQPIADYANWGVVILVIAAIMNLFGVAGHGVAGTASSLSTARASMSPTRAPPATVQEAQERKVVEQAETKQAAQKQKEVDDVTKAQTKAATKSLSDLAAAIRNAKV